MTAHPASDIAIAVTAADHPQVVALLDELDVYLAGLYPPEANHILDVQALLQPDVHFIAAWEQGRAVGCGAVRRMPGEAATGGAPYGEVKRMFVHPDARGRRLGERLIETLEAALRAQGVAHALLETGEAQVAAVTLYERMGYRRRGAFGGYPDNGLSLFYEKRL